MIKTLLRVSLALILTCSMILSLACTNSQLAKNADRAALAFNRAQPIVQSLIDGKVISELRGGAILARLKASATDCTALANAFRNNDNATALDIASRVILALRVLINEDAQLIPAGPQRTIFLAILAAAEVALSFIADDLGPLPANARITKGQASTIEAFRVGKRLHCRSTVDGQWKKMSFCEKHPAESKVESVVWGD